MFALQICAIALGLGLGLGLKDDDDEPEPARGPCPEFQKKTKTPTRKNTGEKWLQQDCSFNDEPVCDKRYSRFQFCFIISMSGLQY